MLRVSWAVFLLAGCARAVPTQTATLASLGGDVTTAELRLRVYELGRRAGSTIETAADSIARLETDTAVRRRTLLWKINATPAFQEAALQVDPLGAAVEFYALIAQMRRFFQDGAGRDAFSTSQPIAVAALTGLEAEAFAIFARAFPDSAMPPQTRENVRKWLTEHPITTFSFARPSIAADWPSIAGGTGRGLIRTVGSLERTVAEVRDRLAFANENLMKQMRWNVELMVQDGIGGMQLDSAAMVGTRALDHFGELAAGAPALVRGERLAVLAGVDTQRVATLAALTRERVAVFDAVAAERASILAALRAERVATIASIDSLTDVAFDRTERLVDRTFARAALLLAVLLAGGVILVLVAARAWRRGGGRPTQTSV